MIDWFNDPEVHINFLACGGGGSSSEKMGIGIGAGGSGGIYGSGYIRTYHHEDGSTVRMFEGVEKKKPAPEKALRKTIDIMGILDVRTGAEQERRFVGFHEASFWPYASAGCYGPNGTAEDIQDSYQEKLEASAINMFPMVLKSAGDIENVFYKKDDPNTGKVKYAFSIFKGDRAIFQGEDTKASRAFRRVLTFITALEDIKQAASANARARESA